MPRGDKSSNTNKQKRQAEHIEKGYEGRGATAKESARRAWATVNAETQQRQEVGVRLGARRKTTSRSRKGARSAASASDRNRGAKKGLEARR